MYPLKDMLMCLWETFKQHSEEKGVSEVTQETRHHRLGFRDTQYLITVLIST